LDTLSLRQVEFDLVSNANAKPLGTNEWLKKVEAIKNADSDKVNVDADDDGRQDCFELLYPDDANC